MKGFVVRRLVSVLVVTGLLSLSSEAMASAYQIWEQDGASIGNFHAGYAAIAEDASTAFYNPAGITRFQGQQLVIGAVGVAPDFKYTGNISVATIYDGEPQTATGQGGTFAVIPDLHYVAPISENVGFGFSIVVPFGAKSDYGRGTPIRYAATYTAINVLDFSPDLAVKFRKFSLGAGFDIQRMYGEFDSVFGTTFPAYDTTSTNKLDDTGYGFHLGGLYEFNDNTRIGLSYHSQVVHHLTGTSNFQGPWAAFAMGLDPETHSTASIIAYNTRTNITLPAYTAFSVFHRTANNIGLMGSAIFTQWNNKNNLVLQNVAGMTGTFDPTKTLSVVSPQYFRNTWNISLGANYYLTDTIILRSGLGYDQTPVRDAYRTVQLPDNDHYVIALGSHFQATQNVGLDLSWLHVFMNNAKVNPPPLHVSSEVVTTNGSVKGGADVLGGQVTWNIT